MKTPYDAACRWKSHVLDQLRRQLTEQYAKQEAWAKAQDVLDAQVLTERATAQHLPLLSSDAFVARCAAEKAALTAKLAEIKTVIAAAQDEIAAAFHDAKALDIAKERFMANARAEAARLEAAALDDVVSRRRVAAGD